MKIKYSKSAFLLCFLPAGWSVMKESFGTQVHLCTSGLPQSDKWEKPLRKQDLQVPMVLEIFYSSWLKSVPSNCVCCKWESYGQPVGSSWSALQKANPYSLVGKSGINTNFSLYHVVLRKNEPVLILTRSKLHSQVLTAPFFFLFSFYLFMARVMEASKLEYQ